MMISFQVAAGLRKMAAAQPGRTWGQGQQPFAGVLP